MIKFVGIHHKPNKLRMTILKRFLMIIAVLSIAVPVQAQFRSLLKKANKQYELHAFNLAIGSYQAALRRRPDSEEALGKLADCYRHLNDMEQAARWYAQAVKQRKVDPIHILNYGKVLKGMGRYAEAKQLFQRYQNHDAAVGNHYAASCNFAISQLNAPSAYIISEEPINTSFSEFGPTFFGDQLVYSSARTDIQRSSSGWTGSASNQLFLANIDPVSGQLTSPTFFKPANQNAFNEGPLTFSSDGRTVLYTKNDFVDGTRHLGSSGMQLDIFEATVDNFNGWQRPKAFPYNDNTFSTGFPNLSPDGEKLYFASNRPDGFGGFDIYVSYRTKDGWSTPENLGPVINSPGDEVTPFFDGQSLYFSSDWHQGMGGYDVFRATQNNDRWIRIAHLGSKVNSPGDDYGFIFDSFRNIGYLSSNRSGGRGNGDIFKVIQSGDGIKIRVKNSSDGNPISGAEIDFSACGRGQHLTDANGIYSFQLQGNLNCDIIIRKDSFISSNVNINTSANLASARGKSFEVTLSKIGEEYIGKIVSYATRRPANGVSIFATNQTTGSYSETRTNQAGEYALALSPNSVYLLRYSSPGFRDVNRTVRTGSADDRAILGIISLLPSSAPNDDANDTSSGSNTDGMVGAGYAVQIAALGTPEMDKFDYLNDLGQLYYKSEGNFYKIRLGVFNDRQAAERALATVKERGISGAFIAEERGGAVGTKSGEQEKGGDGSENEDFSGIVSNYKIQLGAFINPARFNAEKVMHLGVIEDRIKNKYTLKLLAGYETEEEAKSILAEVKRSGFADAFVVKDENGQLIKVR